MEKIESFRGELGPHTGRLTQTVGILIVSTSAELIPIIIHPGRNAIVVY